MGPCLTGAAQEVLSCPDVSCCTSDGAGGFSVAVQYDGSADDAYAEAEQALTGAGLSASDVIDTLEGSNSGAFEGNGYDVLVSVIDSAGEPAVNYVVTAQR